MPASDIPSYVNTAGTAGSDILSLLSNIPGLSDLANSVPYISGLLSLLRIGQNASAGNIASLLAGIPSLAGTVGGIAGTGALGAGMAAAAPALGTIGTAALPAAAAAYFATNDLRQDAERRKNELKEWMTARKDLPTTMRQQANAFAGHQAYQNVGDLTDEDLRNLTGRTQSGLASLVPGGHALMQLGAGEDFAGIKPTDVSRYRNFTAAATPIMGRDYMTAADEFSRRGLTLGGDPQTALHGSMYDPKEEQWRLNAPDPADMLKDWAVNAAPDSPEAKKVNEILDASRRSTAGGGVTEKFNIPDFKPGNYGKAFDAFTHNLLNVDPTSLLSPDPNDPWQGGVYRGPNPNEYNPYSPMTGGGA